MDSTTLFALKEFCQKAQAQRRHISLARVKDTVRGQIAEFEQHEALEKLPMYWSVDDAVKSGIKNPDVSPHDGVLL